MFINILFGQITHNVQVIYPPSGHRASYCIPLSYAIRNEKLMTGDKILLDEGAMGNASVGDLPGGSVNIPDEVSQGSG
jgi:hypothetical protein